MRQQSRNAQALQDLNKYQLGETSLSIFVGSRKNNYVAEPRPLLSINGKEDEDLPSTSGRGLELDCPLKLRLTGTKAGQLDLQLQFLSFKYGSKDVLPSGQQIPIPQSMQGVGNLLGTAASLIFLRLAFPSEAPAIQKLLARAGTAAAVGTVVSRTAARSRSYGRHSQSGQSVRKEQVWGVRRGSKSLRGLQRRVAAAGRKSYGVACSAALLAAAAFLWRQIHPDSHQLMQAIVVAIELSSGYAETKRKAARGYIKPGPEMEAAWRARHKWGARRAGSVLTDCHESPPLAPFLTAAQRLSIGVLMLIDGHPGCRATHPGQQLACVPPCWSAPGNDSSWILNLSYPIGSQGGSDKENTRSAQEVTKVAQVNTSSAGHNDLPGQGRDGANAWLAAAMSAGGQRDREREAQNSVNSSAAHQSAAAFEHVSESEKASYFQPSHTENLKTGNLPTICSMEDMRQYKRKQAQLAEGDRNAMHSPFTQGSSQEGKQQEDPNGIKLFTTEELVSMDPGINRPGGHNQKDELLEGCNLALYGRSDHSMQEVLTTRDKQKMVLRAFFLVAVFLPFILLGPLLIALSKKKPSKAPPPAIVSSPTEDQDLIGESLNDATEVRPAGAPASRLRLAAYHLLLWGIRNGGAAFIKWGQWSATREDMFPPELCHVLAELHDQAPVHSWRESKREIEAAFKKPVEELFESIDHEPLASGSIAQVHKAIMIVGGRRRSVVVKVRHPGVEVRIKQDFQILKPLAAAASQFKALKGLSLKESLAQFSSTMTAQTDLRVEAAHLRRFFRNFASVRDSVTPPFPLPEYISEAVLIETFEPGESVAKYIKDPAPFNTQVVALGVDTYLKMLLTDNFVHTDLHPGNILVRRRDGGGLNTNVSAEKVRGQLQLILLDFGLAEELTPTVRHHFISFLHAIAAGNGMRAANHILKWSNKQTCPDPEGFIIAMIQMFKIEAQIDTPAGIELDKVMKEVLRIARQFEVSIDSSYAALVIGVVVLVGFATSMDPAVNLMDAAAPAFLQSSLIGKVTGRLY